jgi:hypothetical protein
LPDAAFRQINLKSIPDPPDSTSMKVPLELVTADTVQIANVHKNLMLGKKPCVQWMLTHLFENDKE